MRRAVCRSGVIIALLLISLSSSVFAQSTGDREAVSIAIELGNISTFALSTDHNRLLIADTTGDLYIWDLTTRETARHLDSIPSDVKLNNLSWSADDRLVAGAFSDKGRLWRSTTGELIQEFDDHPLQLIDFADTDLATGANGIVFAPSGALLATYNYFDETVLLYDVDTATITHQLPDHPDGGIEEVAFSADGSRLAVRQLVGGITVWDTQTGDRIFQVPGEVMAFSHAGSRLATGQGRLYSQLWIWNSADGQEVAQFAAPLSATELLWSLDDQALYATLSGVRLVGDGWRYNGEAIHHWQVEDSISDQIFGLVEEARLPLDLDANEDLIGIGTYLEGEVLIWNRIRNEVYRHTLSAETTKRVYPIYALPIYTFILDPSQDMLAAGHDAGISLWDVATGDWLTMLATRGRVVKLAFSSTTRQLISLTADGNLIVWQWDTP